MHLTAPKIVKHTPTPATHLRGRRVPHATRTRRSSLAPLPSGARSSRWTAVAGGREREEEEDLVYSVCRIITYSLFVDVDIK